jgi:hypothetical protein
MSEEEYNAFVAWKRNGVAYLRREYGRSPWNALLSLSGCLIENTCSYYGDKGFRGYLSKPFF